MICWKEVAFTKMTRVSAIALALAFSFQVTSCQYPIDPLPWEPPPKPPMEGVYAPNLGLVDAQLIAEGLLNGPEDVAIDEQGRLYCGSADGVIHRVWSDGLVEVFARTGGHPLGLDFDPAGNLIVCEPFQGLISVEPDGNVTLLVDQADGLPLGWADDVDVASDGMIYFSDATWKFHPFDDLLDMLEARPNGRLISYDPYSQQTQVLLDDLYFANGVALSQEEDFVLVNESFRYRIRRYWLEGPHAGSSEVFVENLPAFPDGISANGIGTFWVAFPSLRSDLVDSIHPYPAIKLLASLLITPDIHNLADPHTFVAEMGETGEVLATFHDPTGSRFTGTTSVEESGGYLYLGAVYGDAIGRLLLP